MISEVLGHDRRCLQSVSVGSLEMLALNPNTIAFGCKLELLFLAPLAIRIFAHPVSSFRLHRRPLQYRGALHFSRTPVLGGAVGTTLSYEEGYQPDARVMSHTLRAASGGGRGREGRSHHAEWQAPTRPSTTFVKLKGRNRE